MIATPINSTMRSTANTRCRTIHATTNTAITPNTTPAALTCKPVRGASFGTTRGPVWGSTEPPARGSTAVLDRLAVATLGFSRVWQIKQVPGAKPWMHAPSISPWWRISSANGTAFVGRQTKRPD